jgi:hypothetical protein
MDEFNDNPAPHGAARKIRARRIRTITVTGAVTGFVAVWSVVYSQMASGHDPALGKSESTAVTSSDQTTQSSPTTSDDYSTGDPDWDSGDTDTESNSSAPAPATSSQS